LHACRSTLEDPTDKDNDSGDAVSPPIPDETESRAQADLSDPPLRTEDFSAGS